MYSYQAIQSTGCTPNCSQIKHKLSFVCRMSSKWSLCFQNKMMTSIRKLSDRWAIYWCICTILRILLYFKKWYKISILSTIIFYHWCLFIPTFAFWLSHTRYSNYIGWFRDSNMICCKNNDCCTLLNIIRIISYQHGLNQD